MSNHRLFLSFLCVALALCFVQVANAQGKNALLNGEYIFTEFFTEDVDGSTSMYNRIIFDGEGTGTFEIIYNSMNYSDSGTVTYTVYEDGTFLLFVDELTLRGIVNADGESFIMAEMEEGEYGVYIGIRKSTGLTNAALDGDYVISGYFMEEGSFVSALSAVSFDGNGNGTIEGLYRSRDEIGTIPFTYTVSDDGTFTLTITENSMTLPGIVRADGDHFSMVNLDSEQFGLYNGIKKSQGLSTADIKGEYIITGYVNEDETSAEYVLANLYGDGTGTIDMLQSSTGESFFTAMDYTVGDDGMFYITVTDEGESVTMPGIVSSDKTEILFVNILEIGFGVYAGIKKSSGATAVEEDNGEVPESFTLRQNYPNPFNPTTTIHYTIPQSGHVRLSVYNVVGELVRTLVDQERSHGDFAVNWNGLNDHGQPVSSGVYLYTLTVGERSILSRRMLLQK